MGRPYANELNQLEATYQWARSVELGYLPKGLARCFRLPLLAVGSGGSLTACHYMALLHQTCAGAIARAITPLEIECLPVDLRHSAAVFVSAAGRNRDILHAFETTEAREPRELLVLTGRGSSPLARRAIESGYAELIAPDLPVLKDGFLATNTLLAFCTLLYRAYQEAYGGLVELPAFASLVHPEQQLASYRECLRKRCEVLWRQDSLIVLYGPCLQPAAADLESKFTEAALGYVQLADYRNFGHGRHHWLAKRGTSCSILALVDEQSSTLARKTLALLPTGVTVVELKVAHSGPLAALAGIAHSLYLAGMAGESVGIDPGRPGVPEFGSRIYHLSVFSRESKQDKAARRAETIVQRKMGGRVPMPGAASHRDALRGYLSDFLKRLAASSVRTLALDYDGTLCHRNSRFDGLDAEIAEQLNRILHAGMLIGIATGRGDSARDALRKAVDPEHWHRVLVGYHNGAEIGGLDDTSAPSLDRTACELPEPVCSALVADWRLRNMLKIPLSRTHASITPSYSGSLPYIWELARSIVQNIEPLCNVVVSGHAVDVLAPGISKTSLVDDLIQAAAPCESDQVLCIGDCGRWPGNDASLLAHELSLSVDEVSDDPHTCWNIAPPGIHGVQATRVYLRALVPSGEAMRFVLDM